MGRIYKRANRYGVDYADHRGKRIRKLVSTDKTVALRMLADLLEVVEKRRIGILQTDPAEAKRPIQEHIAGYVAELKRRGRDPMYIYIVQRRIEAACFAQTWESLNGISTRGIGEYLKDLAADGKSARTVNQHRSDLSAFLSWCVRQGALESNPCEHVQKSAVKIEKRRKALSVAECRRLLAAAPPDRALVYRFLMLTGLRRAEAAAVRWTHLHLDAVNAYVELPAAMTKSGHPETVPLIPDLARALRAHGVGARDQDRVFDSIPSMDEFRDDLDAAGIDHEDERGRRVVLHSLRHSLATMLAQSNVPPGVAMRILRHRSIALTMETYTDESLLPTAAAMATLPPLTAEA